MPPATFLLAVLVAVVEVVVVVGATATVDAEEAGEVDGGGRSFISDRSPSANDDDSLRPLLFLSSGNKLRVISYGDSSSAVDSSPSSPPLADDGSGENSAVRPGCL